MQVESVGLMQQLPQLALGERRPPCVLASHRLTRPHMQACMLLECKAAPEGMYICARALS